MAGGQELADAPKTRSTANETGNKLHWERGEQGEAHSGEEWSRRWLGEDGDADGGRQSSELLRAAVVAGTRREWSGERERDTRGARLRLKRSRGTRGRALPRRQGGGCGLATWPGGSEGAGRGGGHADGRGRAVSGWAREAGARCWAGGCLVRVQAQLLGWARLAGLLGCAKLGRAGKRGGELGWGWCWAECEEGEEMEGNFLFFLFINKIFKLIFKRFF